MANPPFASRVPVEGKPAENLWYGDGNQYGFVFKSGAQNVVSVVNNPPFALRVPVESRDPSRRFWLTDGWQYGFTFNSGALNVPMVVAPVNNPPPYEEAVLPAVRSTWPPDAWPVQSLLGKVVQAYAGDGPPGAFVPPEVDEYQPIVWGAQSLTRGCVAPFVVPPPIVNPPPVNSNTATVMGVRQAWADPTWNAQTAFPVAASLTPAPINFLGTVTPLGPVYAWQQPSWAAQRGQQSVFLPPVVNNPPPASITPSVNLRATWGPDQWSAQVARTVAYGYVPPPPPPVPPASLAAEVRSTWPVDAWPTQKPLLGVTLIQPVNPPPVTFPALAVAQVRGLWADITWPSQTGHTMLPLPVVSNPVPRSIAAAVSVRSAWAADAWNAQRSGLTAQFAPVPPRVDQPTPISGVRFAAVRGGWAPDDWRAQQAAPMAPFAPPPPVISVPTPTTFAPLYATRSAWPIDAWPAQSVFSPLAFVNSVSIPVTPVGIYVIDPEFINEMDTANRTFRFQEIVDTEGRVLTFDFANDLLPGQTLTGTISVTVEAFADPSVLVGSQILNGPPAFDSSITQVMQPVMGFSGSAGVDFYFKVSAQTTSPTTTLVRTGILPVRG